jgi:putative transposase
MTPGAIVSITLEEAETLFRPRVERTLARGEIALFGNRYFSRQLEEYHGERIQAGYDIHDPQWIWVYDEDGRFLAKAEWNGNARDYMPKAVIEQARDKRARGRKQRAERVIDEIEAERKGSLPLEVAESINIGGIEITRETLSQGLKPIEQEPDLAPVYQLPESPQHRYEQWLALDEIVKNGGIIENNAELRWWNTYRFSREYAARTRANEPQE